MRGTVRPSNALRIILKSGVLRIGALEILRVLATSPTRARCPLGAREIKLYDPAN